MKKSTLILLFLIITLGLPSCVKQNNCDCDYTGIWQYLEEPYYVRVNGALGDKRKIVAHIVNTSTSMLGKSLDDPLRITGNVPREYVSISNIPVRFCAERVKNNGHHDNGNLAWKLLCIEQIK